MPAAAVAASARRFAVQVQIRGIASGFPACAGYAPAGTRASRAVHDPFDPPARLPETVGLNGAWLHGPGATRLQEVRDERADTV